MCEQEIIHLYIHNTDVYARRPALGKNEMPYILTCIQTYVHADLPYVRARNRLLKHCEGEVPACVPYCFLSRNLVLSATWFSVHMSQSMCRLVLFDYNFLVVFFRWVSIYTNLATFGLVYVLFV